LTIHLDFKDCPCSGKEMGYFAAPWILLTIHNHQGTHGYEIKKFLKGYMDDLGFSLNIGGLYRHLKAFEQRGILSSQWDTPGKGPAKRRYFLTEHGRECLWRWTQTLHIQLELITRFFHKAKGVFPAKALPRIQFHPRGGASGPLAHSKAGGR
jgi:DNA-binding PadR family transcriptional regulator